MKAFFEIVAALGGIAIAVILVAVLAGVYVWGFIAPGYRALPDWLYPRRGMRSEPRQGRLAAFFSAALAACARTFRSNR